jgi:uncharacterized protein (TIGR02453 family)
MKFPTACAAAETRRTSRVACAYTPETLKFYRGLRRNQKKEWFEKNKPLYQKVFVEASRTLIERLAKTPEFRALDLKGGPRTIFRIYRDVRFSNDKRPYKTHGAFVMTRSGNKNDPGVFYFHVQPDGDCGMYLGYWQLDPKLLVKLRHWIAEHPEKYLENVEKRLASRKLKFSTEDDMKRLPRGFETADERVHHALKRRSFGFWESLTDADVTGPRLEAKIRSFVRRAAPLVLWGEALVGHERDGWGENPSTIS